MQSDNRPAAPARASLGRGKWLLAAALATLVACAEVQPLPVTDERVATALMPPSETALEEALQSSELTSRPMTHPDVAVGLSPDEVAMLAVAFNPQLRAARNARDVAAGQVVQAGIVPNLQLDGALDWPTDGVTDGTVVGYGLGLSWDLAALAGRGAGVRAAERALDAAELEIAWAEWQVAQEARLHAYRLLALANRLEVAAAAEAVWMAEVERAQRGTGAGLATALDLGSARAGLQEARMARLRLEQEQAQERLLINAAVGLAPDADLVLERTHALRAWEELPSLEALSEGLRQRLDLRALERGYESQDETLRAAVRSGFPSLGIGVNRARDTGDLGTVGVSVTLDLPFFDRNQGGVAVERATRQQLYDEYLGRIWQTRYDIAGVLADMVAIREQIRTSEESLPALEALAEAGRHAVADGRLNVIAAYELRRRLLGAQLELAELRGVLVELGIALETAAGRWLDPSLPPPGTGGGTPPTEGGSDATHP